MAAFLAQKIEEQGHAISTSMVEAAALLHDVDKALPKSEPLKGLGHADAGAHWLSDNGYGELSARSLPTRSRVSLTTTTTRHGRAPRLSKSASLPTPIAREV